VPKKFVARRKGTKRNNKKRFADDTLQKRKPPAHKGGRKGTKRNNKKRFSENTLQKRKPPAHKGTRPNKKIARPRL
jgi:hypothetical protein